MKASDILRVDFNEPQWDLIILLRKAFGKPDCRYSHPWMFQHMTIILIGKQYFDWAQILLDNIHKQLIDVHKKRNFSLPPMLSR